MTDKHNVEIVPFKRNAYDRGSKKIMVDGVEWGSYRMEAHGCHGPSYHAEDHYGAVSERERTMGSRKGEPVEHRFNPKGKRDYRWSGDKPMPTDEQLRIEAERLIQVGALRSPEACKAERERANARYLKEREAAEQREAEEFATRARAAIPVEVATLLRNYLTSQVAIKLYNEMESAIVEAMRWAQQK